MAHFDRRIVTGPLLPAVWSLAWPIVLQNLFTALQGFVDHAMVGHFVGFLGNAAIGVSWHIFMAVVIFANALHWGMGVLVARFAGADDPERVRRVLFQALLTSFALGLFVLAPLGWFVAPHLLRWVNTTPEVAAEALPYLRLHFLFSFLMLTLNMIWSSLRAAGDARTPLRLGVALTLLNIGLNVVLIRGLGPIPGFGTRGAALGTVIAHSVVLTIALTLLAGRRLVLRLPEAGQRRLEWRTIAALFRFGLPSGLQGTAVNLGYVVLVRYVGSLPASAEAQAAYAVCNMQLFMPLYLASAALMAATQTMVGQSLGAGEVERARRAPRAAALVGLGVAVPSGLAFLLAPRFLLGLFGIEDPTVLALGEQFLAYLGWAGVLLTLALTYVGALQGAGDTRTPAWIAVLSQVVVPLGLCAAADAVGRLTPGVLWSAIVLGHATRAAFAWFWFRRERWRTIAVGIDLD